MTFARHHALSRRGFCLCCASAAATSATGAWLRPCSITPSGGDEPLEAHPGHEQRREHGHAARGLAAHLVIDPEPAVAQEAAERLLRFPPSLLQLEAPPVLDPDDLDGDAVPVEEGLGLLPGEAAVEPGQPQGGVGGGGGG